MNVRKIIFAVLSLSVSTDLLAWDENWTGEVSKITVYENESANIFISNPRNGPTNDFNCYAPNNIIHLGVKGSPAPKVMVSQALAVYMSQKTIRFGIRRVGAFCEAAYITAE